MKKYITTADLSKIKEDILEDMKNGFKKHGRLFPTVLIIEPNGNINVIGTPYATQEEKGIMMDMVKAECKELDAIAVCIINEAWVRCIKKEDYAKVIENMKKTGKNVSDFEDKKEVAVMIFETKLTQEATSFDIDRVNNELFNKFTSNNVSGSFANILSPIIQNN